MNEKTIKILLRCVKYCKNDYISFSNETIHKTEYEELVILKDYLETLLKIKELQIVINEVK